MDESSFKNNPESKQIFKVQAFSEINFVQFVEDIFFMVSTHTIINIIVSFIFFFILIFDSVLLIIQHESSTSSAFRLTDNFFYITTFTVENPTSFEVNIATITSIVIFITYFIVLTVILLLKSNDFPFVRKFYCFLCHYLIPCTFPTLFNCVMITYKYETSFKISNLFTFGANCCFLIVLSYIIITTFFSPFIINHPFCLIRPSSTAIFYLYLLFFTCSHISKHQSLIYARFVLSILLLLYFLIQMPFFGRCENFLILLFVINEILCVSLYIFCNTRQQRLSCYLIGFPLSLVLDGLIIFLYYPYAYFRLFNKSHALLYFYQRQLEECKNYIETMNLKTLSHDDTRLVIMMSLYLNCANSSHLISRYNQNIRYIHEAVFVTISYRMLNTHQETISKRLMEPITFYEGRVKERNEQFWTNVLYSNIYNLPIIASQIGRDKYRLLNYYCFLAKKFPKMERPPEVKKHLNRPVFYQVIMNLGYFDVLIFIIFWAFLVGHIMIYTSNHNVAHLLNKYFVVHDFSSDFYYVISDLWDRKSEINHTYAPSLINISLNAINKKTLADSIQSNLTTHWDSMLDKFAALYTINDAKFFEPLAELETNFLDILPKLQDYIYTLNLYPHFADSAKFFPYAEFTSIVNSFDLVFTSIYTIFTELTYHQRNITTIYFNTVIIVFSAILNISLICYFFVVRAKTIRFFESFRTMNKQDVLNKCHSQATRSAHKDHFHFIQSLPATTWYFILLLISISVLAIILAYNQFINDNNHTRVLTISYGFSQIQRICLWLVSTITHYEFQEYNTTYYKVCQKSLISCDTLTDSLIRNSSLSNFRTVVPEKVIQSIGASLISKDIEKMSNLSEWRQLLSSIIKNSDDKSAEFQFIPQYYTTRVIIFIISSIYFYGWFAYTLLQFAPLYKSERREFLGKDKEAGPLIDFKLQKVKEEDFPIDFYLVDGNSTILLKSKQADHYLANTNHSIELYESVKKEIEKLTKQKTQNYVELHNGFETILIVPSYDFSKKDISFNNALVIIKHEYQTNFSYDQYKKLFYSIYPSYIDTNTNFPLTIDKSLRSQFYIIILKINGFNQWAATQPIGVVSNYKQILSSRIFDKCQEDSFFKLRETSDTLFIAMKHEQKQTARWDLLKSTASFANELMEIAKGINNDFDLPNSRVYIVLYKTFEPKTILGNSRMQLTDFKSDAIFKAEGRASKSIADMVVYSPEHTEAILTNASKVKTCYTSNGDSYDLWFVV